MTDLTEREVSPTRVLAHLDGFLDEVMSAWRVPGTAVALRTAGGEQATVLRGVADREAGSPVTENTLFRIGSITKSLTALAVLREAERGRLDLTAPITEYLPWFRVRGMRRPITLHELLSHTSGLTKWVWFHPSTLAEVIGLAETRLIDRGSYRYSTVGYGVVQLVLERVTGRPFSELVRAEVLEPAGMGASFPHVTNAIRSRLAVGYSAPDDRRPWHPTLPLAPAPWMEWIHGGGSAASTIGDMSSYLGVLLAHGEPVVSRESFEVMTAPALGLREGWGYGYGVENLEAAPGRHRLYHTGGNPGFGSAMLLDPEAGVAVAVLCNSLTFRFFAPWEIAAAACDVAAAVARGERVPPPPDLPDRTRVADADRYAGRYRSGGRELVLEARGERLELVASGLRAPLERFEEDVFYPRLPEPPLQLVRFGRTNGAVSYVSWGDEWLARDGATAGAGDAPAEWAAFTGRFRCYRPWAPEFEVVPRPAGLALVLGGEVEVPLRHVRGRRFRVDGEGEFMPQEIVFGEEIDGRAVSIRCDGFDVYRYALV